MAEINALAFILIMLIFATTSTFQQAQEQIHQDLSQSYQCAQSQASSEKLEKVIDECQDEIKQAVLQEALESLQEAASLPQKRRESREAGFSKDEKTIAGADPSGFPDPDGLVRFYVDGVEDPGYNGATRIAVHLCTRQGILQRRQTMKQESEGSHVFVKHQRKLDTSVILPIDYRQKVAPEYFAGAGAQACDEAFDVFQCVTERLATYCGKN